MIKATIIQDSIANGVRITTYELEYPRFVHSEMLTHRQFSRNAASSRAIPVKTMLKHIEDHPAVPTHWGANQAGMQAATQLEGKQLEEVKCLWQAGILKAIETSQQLSDAGLHKQLANRPTEWAQIMKTVVTATEFDNWEWLRNHEDAQPEIKELAKQMLFAKSQSTPMLLMPGDLHVPYVQRIQDSAGQVSYVTDNGNILDKQTALQVSASCCAQVSYRKSDDSIEKAKMVFDRLINSSPVHASPVEHQAWPMEYAHIDFSVSTWETWENGITHVDRKGQYWSGNFRAWVQYRQIIPNNSR